jgi:hypothetical protein
VEEVKAIVAEIDKKQMIVITENGDFLKVKRQMSAAIGDEIQLKQQKKYLSYKRLAGIAACFLACIFLSTGVYAYYTPYSYVSLDINPSISLSLNRFERVISVNPLTEDAVSFIKETKNLKNQNIDKALSEIISSASDKGYIDEKTENQIMIVVSTKNPKEETKLEDTLTQIAAMELSKVNESSEATVEKTTVEIYKTAVSNNVSPGKEILADKLREFNPEITDEEVEDMSVKEMAKLIKEGRKSAKEEEKDNKEREKDEDKDEDKGAAKSADEGKSNKNNDEKIKPEIEASKNANDKKDDIKDRINDKKDELRDRIEAEKEEKEKAREEAEGKGKAEENKKKDWEDEDEDKNNTKEIEDRDKKNDDPKGKGNDNRRDSRGKDRNRAK